MDARKHPHRSIPYGSLGPIGPRRVTPEPPPPLQHDRRSHRWVLWTALVGAGLYFAIHLFPLVRADVMAWLAGGRP